MKFYNTQLTTILESKNTDNLPLVMASLGQALTKNGIELPKKQLKTKLWKGAYKQWLSKHAPKQPGK